MGTDVIGLPCPDLDASDQDCFIRDLILCALVCRAHRGLRVVRNLLLTPLGPRSQHTAAQGPENCRDSIPVLGSGRVNMLDVLEARRETTRTAGHRRRLVRPKSEAEQRRETKGRVSAMDAPVGFTLSARALIEDSGTRGDSS